MVILEKSGTPAVRSDHKVATESLEDGQLAVDFVAVTGIYYWSDLLVV